MNKEQIKNIIDNSKSAALILNEDAAEHELLARESLRMALEEKGLAIYQFPEAPESFIAKWLPVLGSYDKPNIFNAASFLIPKNRFEIKEIDYEENEDFFILNIRSKNNNIKKDDIFFESKPMSIGSIFCIGSPKPSIENHLSRFSAPPQEKIALIPKISTSAQSLFDCIKIITGETQPENFSAISSLLLASLISETGEFKENLNADILSFAASLLKNGADAQSINNILQKERLPSFAQILGRALARTRINKHLKSIWTFLSLEDLQKTGNPNPKQILFRQIIKQIKEIMPPQPLYILFWQTENSVWGMISCNDSGKHLLERLSPELGSQIKNNFITAGPYQNFSEAEIKIQYSLKELIV